MPAGRPTLYKPQYCERVIELGQAGKSQVQIACALNVDPGSLRNWAEIYPEFFLALTRAKAEEQTWWEDIGQSALFADKFQAAVWSKSVSSRFRETYTERQEHTGKDGGPIRTEHEPGDIAKALLGVLGKGRE